MADILHAIQVTAPAETIYPLVSSAAGFAKWWAADVAETGGAVELGFFKKQTVYRLRLESKRAPNDAAWVCETGQEWQGTRIVFHLEAAGGGTLVRFTHGGWGGATDYFVSCNTTWGELMFRLKAAAEGKSRGPLFLAESMAY